MADVELSIQVAEGGLNQFVAAGASTVVLEALRTWQERQDRIRQDAPAAVIPTAARLLPHRVQ